jgi:hypothetical protein
MIDFISFFSSFMMLASIEVHPPQPFNEDCSALKTTIWRPLYPSSIEPLSRGLSGPLASAGPRAGRPVQMLSSAAGVPVQEHLYNSRGSSAGRRAGTNRFVDGLAGCFYVVGNCGSKFLPQISLYVYKASNIFP